ncbi:hypothetical protein AAVH_22220 [Aphelenchoides avenae]|nr:hypothetical protein AAVH_22220 [Aphelenchus avenae]
MLARAVFFTACWLITDAIEDKLVAGIPPKINLVTITGSAPVYQDGRQSAHITVAFRRDDDTQLTNVLQQLCDGGCSDCYDCFCADCSLATILGYFANIGFTVESAVALPLSQLFNDVQVMYTMTKTTQV